MKEIRYSNRFVRFYKQRIARNTRLKQDFKDAVDKSTFATSYDLSISTVVPVPAAVWLFGTAVLGFIGIRRKQKVGVLSA